jgi:polyhydroxyalkanoate synthesis regulator phasin
MSSVEDRVERMRMLATAPLFSLWREVRMELEEAATEIEQLRQRVRDLEDDGA